MTAGTIAALLALVQQAPLPGPLPAPPPPPVASTPDVAEAVATARACFDSRWEVARERLFAAERLVARSEPPGSPAGQEARDAVLALVAARRSLALCATELARTAQAAPTDADRGARDYWVEYMNFNFAGQTPFEQALLVAVGQAPGAPSADTPPKR